MLIFKLDNMAPSPLKQDRYAGIDNPIEYLEPRLSSGNNTGISKSPELIRDSLPVHLRFFGKRPNAEFVRTNERVKHA